MTVSLPMPRPFVPQAVPGVEARAGTFPGPSLIPMLNELQAKLGWLPREELVTLARETGRPLYEIQGLISFYPHYRTEPPVPVSIGVCRDLACWLQGAPARTAELAARYAGRADVELTEISCPGRCDAAPAVVVNDEPAAAGQAEALVDLATAGALTDAETATYSPAGRWPNDPYTSTDEHYRVLRRVLAGEVSAEQVVAALLESGLRGMGGAGFPTGKKWELVSQQDGPTYVVVNADESEPGSFKDRQVLAEQPHLVLEGLLLGMLVVGAEHGWVFLRHEYGPERRALERELDVLTTLGVLSEQLKVEIFVSPGGYVLGEESAMIECMEGHRGQPRNKPPFPGVYGLYGRPTLINNVETFAHVPAVVDRGSAWWREQGLGEHAGWKFFAVSGHVARPGVYCVPLGTTVRALLELAGGVAEGRTLGAVQPGGASSNFLLPDKIDVALDFGALAEAGSMLGSGALVVLAEGTDLLAAATNVLRFFREESCGKCVPCRVGAHKAHEILSDAVATGLTDQVRDRVLELELVMRKTSICGLGQVALGPVVSVLGLARGGTEATAQPLTGASRSGDEATGEPAE